VRIDRNPVDRTGQDITALSEDFELFESLSLPPGRQWASFCAGAAIQIAGGALVIFLGLFFTPEIKQRLTRPQYVSLDLAPAPPPPPMPVLRPPRPLPRLTEPPPDPKPRPDELVLPKVEVKQTKPELKAPVLTSEPKKLPDVMPTKLPKLTPKVGVLEARVASADNGPKMKRPGVRTDMFDGSSTPATVKRPIAQVQTGGFGSPEGLPGNAQGGSKGNVAKLGSFDLPSGPGYGNGSGGAQGVRGTVASAGFGNGIATAGGGGGTGGTGRGGNGGGVREGSFAEVRAAAPTTVRPARQASAAARVQPVEILFKPNPVYTEEARRAHVEGEVLLSVVFKASGEIQVVRVVSGLHYGLDEAAVHAAQQIRFKPAQRDGQAVDLPATLHILFQLAS
jgi:TonB family protein